MLNFYDIEKQVSSDHVATPRWVVENIYDLIDIYSFKNIWLPFNNYDSQFKLRADELELQYKATHIFDDVGNDFFITDPPAACDLMISNPPFSLQNEIIERSFELVDQKKISSFALLLPLATLETEKRAKMFDQHKDKLAILVFKKRIKFIGHSTNFPKGCCWICYNIDALKEFPIQWV